RRTARPCSPSRAPTPTTPPRRSSRSAGPPAPDPCRGGTPDRWGGLERGHTGQVVVCHTRDCRPCRARGRSGNMHPMDPRDVMQATAGKIGDIGAAFFFAPETLQRGKDAGLDGFRFYFLGRGGVLGDVESGVIRAAFGYFEPGLVEKIWSSAKTIMAPRDAARLYISCAHDLG